MMTALHRRDAGVAMDEALEPGRASLAGGTFRLGDGTEIACQTTTEAAFLYTDIFERQIYCRHGISLRGARTIFDVGANVGLFTLFASRQAPEAVIHAFEPAPPLFEILRGNVERLGIRAELYPCGLSARAGEATLTFYPNSSGMSSFHADLAQERAALERLMSNELRGGKQGLEEVIAHAEDLIAERLRSVELRCPLRTVSDVIRERGIERIDLLKIDVQKSELEVLAGIDDEHWPRIAQVVLELHDTAGQLGELLDQLRQRGFAASAEQDDPYGGSVMYNVFAVRPLGELAPRSLGTKNGPAERSWHLVTLSAESPSALEELGRSVAQVLERHRRIELADAAYSLQVARRQLEHRQFLVCRDREQAAAALASQDPACLRFGRAPRHRPRTVFSFPGLGNHYRGMAAEIYRTEPAFRAAVDRCADFLEPLVGFDLRRFLKTGGEPTATGGFDLKRLVRGGDGAEETGELARTAVAHPVVFVVEYALARLWQSWGVEPEAMVGYSLGEYVAACLAEALSLEDALALVAERARLIEELPGGAMLAVSASEAELAGQLSGELSLSAVNGPAGCVVGGPHGALAELERELSARGLICRRLATTHAFHSRMMEPVRGRLVELVRGIELRPPRKPYLSNVTGDWITPEQATDPEYWAEHLCRPVRFSAAAERLLAAGPGLFLEVGPGQALCAWMLQQEGWDPDRHQAIPTLRHSLERRSDGEMLLEALGKLWLGGHEIDWRSFHGPAPTPGLLWPTFEEGAPAGSAEGPRPAPEPAPTAQRRPTSVAYVEPRDELERDLCRLWAEILGVERIGIYDSFFELGGDSLKAVRLLSRLGSEHGAPLPLRKLFAAPRVAELAPIVLEAELGEIDGGKLDPAPGGGL